MATRKRVHSPPPETEGGLKRHAPARASPVRTDTHATDIRTTLTCTQAHTLQWIDRTIQSHGAAFVSHDMGHGKTLIALLSCLRAFRSTGAMSLVVTQKGILGVWRQEADKHLCPRWAERVQIFHTSFATPPRRIMDRAFVLVTTYEMINSCHVFVQALLRAYEPYARLVLDEGHMIRNTDTQRRDACMRIKDNGRIMLSGTPFQNSLGDIVSQLGFMRIEPFASLEPRRYVYRSAAEQYSNAFFLAIRQTFLRDRKNERMNTTAEKRVFVMACRFTQKEQDAFDDMLLREECDNAHPFRKRNCILTFCGNSRSKLGSLATYLKTKWRKGKRFLVYANYQIQQANVLEALRAWGIRADMIAGGMEPERRDCILDRFTCDDTDLDALVLSFRACNKGLNIPQAEDVIFMDMSDANPSNYLQAQARAFRPGQTAAVVNIYFIVMASTLEAHVPYLHCAKEKIAKHIMAVIPSSRDAENISDTEARAHFDHALFLSRGGKNGTASVFKLTSSSDVSRIIDGIRTQNQYLRMLIESYHLDSMETHTHLFGPHAADARTQTEGSTITPMRTAAATITERPSQKAVTATTTAAQRAGVYLQRLLLAPTHTEGLFIAFAAFPGLFFADSDRVPHAIRKHAHTVDAHTLRIDVAVLERHVHTRRYQADASLTVAQLYESAKEVWAMLACTDSTPGVQAGSTAGFELMRSSAHTLRDYAHPWLCGTDTCLFLPSACSKESEAPEPSE